MPATQRLILALFLFVASGAVVARTFHVDQFNADMVDVVPGDCVCNTSVGSCTLRAAVMEANQCPGPDTIRFVSAALDQTVVLSITGAGGAEAGDLDVTEAASIFGWSGPLPPDDADRLPILDGTMLADRIFDVATGTSLDIQGFTLRGGQAGLSRGGAIRSYGSLHTRIVRFEGNVASSGGAIASMAGADLVVEQSDFVSNEALGDGGAAIYNLNQATVLGSSFRDNRRSGSGEEVIFSGDGSSLRFENSILSGEPVMVGVNDANGIRAVNPASLSIRNATLVDLQSGRPALELESLDGNGTIRVANSILSNQDGEAVCLISGGLSRDWGDISMDHSLIRQGGLPGCIDVFGPDVIDGDGPLLLPFAQNPRQLVKYQMTTFASGLRDAGNPDAFDIDAEMRCTSNSINEVLRPQDGDADGAARCDLGAAEAMAITSATFVVDSESDGVDASPGDGICASASGACTLRAAVMEANTKPGPDRIEFASGVAQILLASNGAGGAEVGDLQILEQLVIAGSLEGSHPTVEIRNAPGITQRLFAVYLPLGETAQFENLTLSNGSPAVGNGGAILLQSDNVVTLTHVVAVDNVATMGNGGALAVTAGEMILSDVDLAENAAGIQGGAIYVAAPGRLSAENSSVRLHGVAAFLEADQKSAVRIADAQVEFRQMTFAGNELAILASGNFDLSLRNSTFMLREDPLEAHLFLFSARHLVLDGGAGSHFQAIANAFDTVGGCEIQQAPGGTKDTAHYNLAEFACASALGLTGNLVEGANLYFRSAPFPGRVARVVLPRPQSTLVDRVPADALNCPMTTDARGAPRPVNVSGLPAALCDVGAVESSGSEYIPQTTVVNIYDVDLPDATTCNAFCDADEQLPGNQCTLRAAVMENSCHWLWLQPWTTDILIPEPGVTIPLTLTKPGGEADELRYGAGANTAATRIRGGEVVGEQRPLIVASHGGRILVVNTGILELANLRMTGGYGQATSFTDPSGGAIAGIGMDSLYLRNMELFGNQAEERGGAIWSDIAEVFLEKVSIHDNAAVADGSAIQITGGALTIVDSSIYNNTVLDPVGMRGAVLLDASGAGTAGDLFVVNSTISSNNGSGIALLNLGTHSVTIAIDASTLSHNARYGIVEEGSGEPGDKLLMARHSIFSNNLLGSCRVDFPAYFDYDMVGFNISQDSNCEMTGGTNLIGVDPLLGVLSTPSYATAFRPLLPGSPAIDGGSSDPAACPDTDQLGHSRPQDGDGDGIARCNIGAIESNALPPPPPPSDDIFSDSFES